MVQEEGTQKVVSISVSCTKLTARVLAIAMQKYLEQKNNKPHKMSYKKLMEKNEGVSSIVIDDKNIKAFDRVARKYHVNYAVKKDKTSNPPKYIVFFQAKNQAVIEQAFKEFVDRNAKAASRQPFKEILSQHVEKAKDLAKELAKVVKKAVER